MSKFSNETSSILEELLDASRSTVYARLNEAVTAFGLAFCGIAKTYSLETIGQDDMADEHQQFQGVTLEQAAGVNGDSLDDYARIS